MQQIYLAIVYPFIKINNIHTPVFCYFGYIIQKSQFRVLVLVRVTYTMIKSCHYSKFIYIHHFYCSNSDDNLLKNLELFDKLSLRFNRRVLFIKDVIGSNEICCWSFFGHGTKISEVCCTSIVYGTDKKHTKVRLMPSLYYIPESTVHNKSWRMPNVQKIRFCQNIHCIFLVHFSLNFKLQIRADFTE